MKRIEIEINPLEFSWPYSNSAFEAWCLGKLSDAGILIKGLLVFGGVEKGVLTRCDNFKNPNMRFVWEG